MLMDKIGERIAFERTGTRLYDALILKYEILAESDNAPALPNPLDGAEEDVGATLQRIRTEEQAHFLMLSEVMRSLGGDPTAQTPCADATATASMGIMQVVTDPRTTLAQSLNAMLLIALAQEAGKTDMVEMFENAMAEEQEHLATIKGWLTALVTAGSTATTVAA
jgi:hypothetical protein